ncbi:uncharacterized protein LOC135397668 [Ornithodoros turicata]|uniref:uncharacterized protein LOC135397668 n=1 Tax=Ornithodoros turicata TaxID=34597 RepID=UPI003139D56A
MERSKASGDGTSKIPVFRAPSEAVVAEKGLDFKLKQIDDLLRKPDIAVDGVTKFVLGFCKDHAHIVRQLQAQVETLKAENNAVKQKVKRLQQDLDEVSGKVSSTNEDLESVRALVGQATSEAGQSVEYLKNDVKKVASKLSEFEAEVGSRFKDVPNVQRVSMMVQDVSSSTANSLAGRLLTEMETKASASDFEQVKNDVTKIIDRVKFVEDKNDADVAKMKALDRLERDGGPSSPKCLVELHVLRGGARDVPLRWNLPEYEKLKTLSKTDTAFRAFSRPVGVEKEGSVRCVLRLCATFGVVAQEGEECVQFGVEVLHATKCTKKFDFYFRLMDGTGKGRHLVKTFSSNEVFVPRYWLPHGRGTTRLVSFAVLLSEERMQKEGYLFKDSLNVEIGLQ